MSWLHGGDESLHYCDNSHRWLAPPGMDQNLWEAGVRAHIQEHLSTMGGPAPSRCGPVTPNERPRHPTPRAARQRNSGPLRLRKAVPPKADS